MTEMVDFKTPKGILTVPVGSQVRLDKDGVLEEVRKWSGHYVSQRNGRSYYEVDCPFCENLIHIFTWSLHARGKDCPVCNAHFSKYGEVTRGPNVKRQ